MLGGLKTKTLVAAAGREPRSYSAADAVSAQTRAHAPTLFRGSGFFDVAASLFPAKNVRLELFS